MMRYDCVTNAPVGTVVVQVLRFTSLGLWGLCGVEVNRVVAVNEGAVRTLCGWNAILLIAQQFDTRPSGGTSRCVGCVGCCG